MVSQGDRDMLHDSISAPFQRLEPLEQAMFEQLQATTSAQSEFTVNAGPSRRVRSAFVIWLLNEISTRLPRVTHFELRNATIAEALDLRGVHFTILLRFAECCFPSEIDLTDAEVPGLEFFGGKLQALYADRLKMDGSLRLVSPKYRARRSTSSVLESDSKPQMGVKVRQIRLCGARIRGNIDLRGSALGGEIGEERVFRPLFADGAEIGGNVLLSKGFRAIGEVCFNGSKIDRNFDCSGATLINPDGYSLSLAGGNIGGSVILCRQYWPDEQDDPADTARIFRSVGTVRLEGAKISGDLNCANARFTAPAFLFNRPNGKNENEFYAIFADGLVVGANLQFGSDSKAREDQISDEFANYESTTSTSDGARFDILGIVSILNGSVGADLLLDDSRMHFPGEDTFAGDGMTVNGQTMLNNCYCNGVIRFIQANLKQGLTVRGAKFDVTFCPRGWDETSTASELDGPACGIFAPYAQIESVFAWQNVDKVSRCHDRVRFWLDLSGARISGVVTDDKNSWEALDRFDVAGAHFGSISNLDGTDQVWRLRILDRQYAPINSCFAPDLVVIVKRFANFLNRVVRQRPVHSGLPRQHDVTLARPDDCSRDRFRRMLMMEGALERFKPQPYFHLARLYRMAGYQSAATKVLVRLERNQTRYSDFGLIRTCWRWMLELGIRYGHSPFRPIIILLVWALFSAACFQSAYNAHKIVALHNTIKIGNVTRQVPTFNSLVYALDSLLPIVNLGQKNAWTVEPLSKASARLAHIHPLSLSAAFRSIPQQLPDWGAPFLLMFNTFFGWLMTTLFVVGVTGLMRPDRYD